MPYEKLHQAVWGFLLVIFFFWSVVISTQKETVSMMNLLFVRTVYVLERGKINHLLYTNYLLSWAASNIKTVLYVNTISFQSSIWLISRTSNETNFWPAPFVLTCLQFMSSVFYLDTDVISSSGVVHWYSLCPSDTQLHQGLLLAASMNFKLEFFKMGLKSETFLSVQGRTTQDELNQHHPVDSVIS